VATLILLQALIAHADAVRAAVRLERADAAC
jgi:hypothetical protein